MLFRKGKLKFGELVIAMELSDTNRLPSLFAPGGESGWDGGMEKVLVVGVLGREPFDRGGESGEDEDPPAEASVSRNSTHNLENDYPEASVL